MKWSNAPMNEVVKLPEWQKLRKELVGTWIKTPNENCSKIRNFLGSKKDIRKLRIVLNYLTGTGFRIGKISHPEITKLRKEVSDILKKQKKVKTEQNINYNHNKDKPMNIFKLFEQIDEKYNNFLYEEEKPESPPPQQQGGVTQSMGGADMGGYDPSMAGGGDPSMMGGGMGGETDQSYEEKNPYGSNPPATVKNLGRLYELNKIFYTLKTLDGFLLKLQDSEIDKLRKVVIEALDIFKLVIENLETYVNKEMIDDIIVYYYKFISRLMYVIKRYYKHKKHEDRHEDRHEDQQLSQTDSNVQLDDEVKKYAVYK